MSDQVPDTRPAPTHAERIELWKMEQDDRRIAIAERQAEAARIATRTPAEEAFEVEQRMAKTLAASPFLPANVGKDMTERTAAAWGVLRYASMLGVDPYVLAQQIYVVHGRVGFSAAFLVALVNGRANLQKPIDWTVEGDGKALAVTATATDSAGVVRSVRMTWAEVSAWGWATKPGEPWKADPTQMMRYRTAAKLIRLYFGGAVMGLTMTSEELRDLAPDSAEVRGSPRLAERPEPRQISSTANTVVDELLGGGGEPTDAEKAEIARQEQEGK